MITQPTPSKILVFLPDAAGATIVTRLKESGFPSVLASTVPEAFDALRSDEFAFAITTRPDIDLVQNIRAVPVINLEVFFHAAASSDGGQISAKRFDSEAFLERVAFLARAAPESRSYPDARLANSLSDQAKSTAPWWTIAAGAMRSKLRRKETMDVYSR